MFTLPEKVNLQQQQILGMIAAGLAPLPLLPILRRLSWCSTTQQYEEYAYCACAERDNSEDCGGAGKHPEHSWKYDAEAIARTPADVPRLWPANRSERGIAIHCGYSRVVVVDADERHGGLDSLARLIRDFQLPDTWRDDRGGKSPHWYFQEPPGWNKLRLPKSVRLPNYSGIELLSGDHLCNVGGTDHEDGVRREWLPGCAPYDPAAIVAVLPHELMLYADRVTPRGNRRRSSPKWSSGTVSQRPAGAASSPPMDGDEDALQEIKQAARRLAKAADKDGELRRLLDAGQFPRIEAYRNDTLFRVARSLHWHGIDPDDVAETIQLVNDLACRRTLPERELQTMLESAERYDNGSEINEDDLAAITGSTKPILQRAGDRRLQATGECPHLSFPFTYLLHRMNLCRQSY